MDEESSGVQVGVKRTYADVSVLDENGKRHVEALRDPVSELGRAKRKRAPGGDASMLARMRKREMFLSGNGERFRRSCVREKFQGMKLDWPSWDTHDPDFAALRPSFLRRRSKVVEITAAKELVFVLTQTGICAVFDSKTKKRIGFLNHAPDVVIRSLFLNRANESIITVSVQSQDQYRSLRCRSISWSSIRREKVAQYAFFIFDSEELRYPGFVEFDDVNSKVLTHSVGDCSFKVWDLATYEHLFTIKNDRVSEIKISPGIMLVVRERSDSYVPLEIRSLEDGRIIKAWNQILHRGRKIDFIEAFNNKLLVKQQNERMQIVDVDMLVKGPRSNGRQIIELCQSQFLTPNAFVFLYEHGLFLTFRNREIIVWDFEGHPVTQLEDHRLFHDEVNSNIVYITALQDLIISFCHQSECTHGSINISNIHTGRRIAKLTCIPEDEGKRRSALEAVTALYYNEERNEIYSGTRSGEVFLWSH